VDILFASEKLEQLCQDETLATRALGGPCARRLRARLDDLAAAAHLGYAPNLPGRFHPLLGNFEGCFALHLHAGRRLVIRPACKPLPKRNDGSLQMSQVTAIVVEYIGDYHD
jgi:proteic killer suppression protein